MSRLIKLAKLPRKKSLKNFDITRIKGLSKTLIQTLAKGEFIEKHENILIFGNPGTGKTHLAIALAEEWCISGYKVFFITAAALMQELLKAKSELKLNQYIKKIDKYEMLIIDDISYIPCSKEESDVLFNLLSQRYEMKSCLITSNIAFSKWSQIFKDEVTTAAVIDRLIHHANILELNATSYRIENAKNLNKFLK
ncbi:ATP-binding protein [archaeon]|nr:ATP-binding protein [archaeon]